MRSGVALYRDGSCSPYNIGHLPGAPFPDVKLFDDSDACRSQQKRDVISTSIFIIYTFRTLLFDRRDRNYKVLCGCVCIYIDTVYVSRQHNARRWGQDGGTPRRHCLVVLCTFLAFVLLWAMLIHLSCICILVDITVAFYSN